MSTYRHEYKYLCSACQLVCIRSRVDAIMEYDRNAGNGGGYTIRSLYFDDYDDSCLYDNINGTDPREKFRIRIYNGNSQNIKLECKQKKCRMTRKLTCSLPYSVCEKIIQQHPLDMTEIAHPLYRKFCMQQEIKMLRPKIIVEYDRIPYVCQEGNVRITFDMRLRSSTMLDRFFEPDIFFRPVMESGQHLLEVKFDEFLPDYIMHAVQTDHLRQTSFSKYCLCRRYR